jgi:hypothetical protein
MSGSLKTTPPTWPLRGVWIAPLETASWESAVEWRGYFNAIERAAAAQLQERLAVWDQKLEAFGGDPSRWDWSVFRPLRLSREEDWSDWLAHLLQNSRTGRFSARLFGGDRAAEAEWRVASADREIVADTYRADLLIRFEDQSAIHVEVKVGDLALAKMVPTGIALRKKRADVTFRGKDFILLPRPHLSVWEHLCSDHGAQEALAVETITWESVAVALRRSVLDEKETLTWRALAIVFVGAVEQRLLGFPQIPVGADSLIAQGNLSARLELLEEALS